jgi:hypothetical protein
MTSFSCTALCCPLVCSEQANEGSGKQTRTLIPVSAAVNQNHRLRTTAVVETDGRHLLYGDPVTMKIQLQVALTGKKLKDLPVNWQGIRTYNGRRADRNAPQAWQKSFDYFAYNGAFLAQRGTTLVAGVTWELLEGEQDFVTQIWLITKDGVERLRLDFTDERPVGIAAKPKQLSLCTAEVQETETLLHLYPIVR